MQLRPDTAASSDIAAMLVQPGLLHMQGAAKEHKASPVERSCWAVSRPVAVSDGPSIRAMHVATDWSSCCRTGISAYPDAESWSSVLLVAIQLAKTARLYESRLHSNRAKSKAFCCCWCD